jgi:hypothetical protein
MTGLTQQHSHITSISTMTGEGLVKVTLQYTYGLYTPFMFLHLNGTHLRIEGFQDH